MALGNLLMRIVLALLAASLTATAGQKPGDEGTPEFEKASALVKQLGHARFAVREAAGKQLLEMGGPAIPALTAGTKSGDEEVRTRSLALLPQVRVIEWKRRADAYLAKPGEKQDLPLLAEWDKLVEKPDAASRRLFAEMVRTSGDFLQLAATTKSPKLTANQCRRIIDRVQTAAGPVKASIGDLAAVLFADTFNPELGRRRTTPVPMEGILANPTWEEALGTGDLCRPVRKLLARWADLGGPADSLTFQQFADLVRRQPFPEAAPALIMMAKDPKAHASLCRAIAIDALGTVGGTDATAALTALLTDKTDVFDGTPAGENIIGDAALAALIRMDGKKISEYGIDNNHQIVFGTNTPGKGIPLVLYGFHAPGAREKAVEKWKTESAKKGK